MLEKQKAWFWDDLVFGLVNFGWCQLHFVLKLWGGKRCELEHFWNGLRPQTVDLLWLKRPIVLLMCLASGASFLQTKMIFWQFPQMLPESESQHLKLPKNHSKTNHYAVVRTRILSPHLSHSTSIAPWDVLMRPHMHGCSRKSQATGM